MPSRHFSNPTLPQLREQLRAESGDGAALVDNLKDNPICTVSMDSEVPCITVVWKRYATSAQLRYVHEQLLCLLGGGGVAVLGDDTQLPTIHREDQRWIAENWWPRARSAGLRVIANKRSEAHWGRLAVRTVQSMVPPGIEFRSFDAIEDARNWLRSMVSG